MLEITLAVVLISAAMAYAVTHVIDSRSRSNSLQPTIKPFSFLTPLDTGLLAGFSVVALGLYTFAPLAPEHRLPLASILIVVVLAYLFGSLVARYELSRAVQAWGSLVLILIPILGGLSIQRLTLPGLGNTGFPWYLAGILAVLWMTGILTTVDYLSRTDGLALGVFTLASVIMAFQALELGQAQIAWNSLGLAGACIGGLIVSFPWTRVRLGPAGTLMLGFALATLPLLAPVRILIGLGVMVIPLTELAIHFVSDHARRSRDVSQASPDRSLYKWLLPTGMSSRSHVVAYLLVQAGLILTLLLVPTWTLKLSLLVGISLAVIALKVVLARYNSSDAAV